MSSTPDRLSQDPREPPARPRKPRFRLPAEPEDDEPAPTSTLDPGRPSRWPTRASTMTLPSRSESPRPLPVGPVAEQHPKLPAPGDLYLFRLDTEIEPEWLIVRAHPDDPQLLLVVPVDDFPLAGP